MKWFLLCMLFTLICFVSVAQPFIHSHNDYDQAEPLTNALRNKAFTIEADVYLTGRGLLVAHDRKDLPTAKALDSLYLQPIINLFSLHGGKISEDSNYAATLMIDIKDSGVAVITELIKLLAPYPSVFDRAVNAKAVQIVLSGSRGPVARWITYPSYILFDGRPKEIYDTPTLQRVTFISDSYFNYIIIPDSTNSRIEQLVQKVHGMGKLLRIWGIPDNHDSWKKMRDHGVDIINTDKVAECRNYFLK
jgi:glycerophosphoryl diester phosphodiesterase